jgi:cell wall assembly regulator SMI1
METLDWQTFLSRWSNELLQRGNYNHLLTADAYLQRWLGEPGATNEQIAAVEARLGIALPPSYRSFLQVTNGWALTNPAVGYLWSADEIAWFSSKHTRYMDRLSRRKNKQATYTQELQGTLQISEEGETAVYLLNPAVIDPTTGEWEAWIFTMQGSASVQRYPSFRALMQAEYGRFLDEHTPTPSTTSQPDWQTFMSKFSAAMLADPEFNEEFGEHTTPEQHAAGWLGFRGADETQIAATEARLGITLPPSYRAFLKVSNGWSVIAPFVYRLYPVEEIDYLHKVDPQHVSAFLEGYTTGRTELSAHDAAYGDELQHAIAISEYGDAQLLLNPLRRDEQGEMEAWFFASWVPGEQRYGSFGDLMVEMYQSFLRLQDDRDKRAAAARAPSEVKETVHHLADEWENLARAILNDASAPFKPMIDALREQMRQNLFLDQMMRREDILKSTPFDPQNPSAWFERVQHAMREQGLEPTNPSEFAANSPFGIPQLGDEERKAYERILLEHAPDVDLSSTMMTLGLSQGLENAARQIRALFGESGSAAPSADQQGEPTEGERDEDNGSSDMA